MFTVVICMAIIISRVGVNWGDAFFGYVPSHTIVQSGALYTCKPSHSPTDPRPLF